MAKTNTRARAHTRTHTRINTHAHDRRVRTYKNYPCLYYVFVYVLEYLYLIDFYTNTGAECPCLETLSASNYYGISMKTPTTHYVMCNIAYLFFDSETKVNC